MNARTMSLPLKKFSLLLLNPPDTLRKFEERTKSGVTPYSEVRLDVPMR